MSIDPICPKSSGMAGINRFDMFDLDELNMLMREIRKWEPAIQSESPFGEIAKAMERQRVLASKLFGEIAQARNKNEQLANSVYPCPTCKKSSVLCGCSSSCNHGSGPYPLRYCNHCEESFSRSSSCPQ